MTGSHADQQRALYGTTLAERFGAVMNSYGLTQRGLAQVLGLSAPMLSQLINAQRIKIGHPAVFARLVMLETRASEPDREAVLAEVRDAQPVATTQAVPLAHNLAGLASPEQLRATADHAASLGAHQLAQVLQQAAMNPAAD